MQGNAHLLGDVHEEVVENFQQHRIGLGSGSTGPIGRLGPGHHHVVMLRDLRPPTGFDHDGLVILDHQRGALHMAARGQCGAADHGGLMPGTAREDRHTRFDLRLALFDGQGGVAGCAFRGFAFDLDGLDDQCRVGVGEPELGLMRRFERGAGGELIALPCHRQRRIGARIAQMQTAAQCHAVMHALLCQCCTDLRFQPFQRGGECRHIVKTQL